MLNTDSWPNYSIFEIITPDIIEVMIKKKFTFCGEGEEIVISKLLSHVITS